MDITIERMRKVIDFFNEDASAQYRMWYDAMINTIILAKITKSPLDVDVYHMQDDLQVFQDIDGLAQLYLDRGESEESAILNAMFKTADMVVDV